MYKKNKHIHLMGIGGIGVSGIAAILRQQGYEVSGCDASSDSQVLLWLEGLGCKIYKSGHSIDHIEGVDVLVYSSAIPPDHPEIKAAIDTGIPVIPRAIMLAELMRMKYGIAVAGTHGKTTTTSMISHIISESGLDPTIIIGGVLKNLSTHAKLGNGDLLVAEADESDRSLLFLTPCIAVITNIDEEHLDVYSDLDDIKNTFKDFISRLPFYGKAFMCMDDPGVRSILPMQHVKTVGYGLHSDSDIQGKILQTTSESSTFEIFEKTRVNQQKISVKKLGQITLKIAGMHNVQNSIAAVALSLELEIPFKTIKDALETFKGVKRRFEFKGTYKNAEIFDDYGHHPTEIATTLEVAKRRAKGKLYVVFQPHRYSRTQKLWKKFLGVFSRDLVDHLILTKIYSAGESEVPGITSQNLLAEIKKTNPNLSAVHFDSYDEIVDFAKKNLRDGDMLITIGAGKANCVGNRLINEQT